MSDGYGIPASWYPDPADSSKLRYWDGATWTQQVRDASANVAPAAVNTAMSASAVNSPLSDFTGYDRIGQSASYVPFSRGGVANASAHSRTATGSASTVAIWLYALVPLLLLLHQLFPWEYTTTDFTNLLIHGGLALVTVLLAILFAAIDRSQLRNRGFERTPPAIIGVLPPIHVFARLFTTSPVAVFVTLASLIVQGVVVAILAIAYLPTVAVADIPTAQPIVTTGMTAPFTEQQLAYLLTPEGMAEKIRFDAAQSSLVYETVDCDPLVSKALGAQTNCHATSQIADYELLIQVLPDGTNVPFVVESITPVAH